MKTSVLAPPSYDESCMWNCSCAAAILLPLIPLTHIVVSAWGVTWMIPSLPHHLQWAHLFAIHHTCLPFDTTTTPLGHLMGQHTHGTATPTTCAKQIHICLLDAFFSIESLGHLMHAIVHASGPIPRPAANGTGGGGSGGSAYAAAGAGITGGCVKSDTGIDLVVCMGIHA